MSCLCFDVEIALKVDSILAACIFNLIAAYGRKNEDEIWEIFLLASEQEVREAINKLIKNGLITKFPVDESDNNRSQNIINKNDKKILY